MIAKSSINEKRTRNTIIPDIAGMTDPTSVVKRFKDRYNETAVKIMLIITTYET